MPDLTGFNSALSTEATQPLSYYDWATQIKGFGANDYQTAPDSFAAKFMNWFTGDLTNLQNEYDLYLANRDKEWELGKINDARSWEEYMSNTAFSRQMKDIENSGFNPLLALTGGAGSGAPVMSSPSGSSSTSYRGSYKGFEGPDQLGDIGKLVTTALMLTGMAVAGHYKLAATKYGVNNNARMLAFEADQQRKKRLAEALSKL